MFQQIQLSLLSKIFIPFIKKFWFPHYKRGNILPHLELIEGIQLQKILEEDKPTIQKNTCLFAVGKKRKHYEKARK